MRNTKLIARMNLWLMIVLCAFSTGCATTALKDTTVNQGKTFTELYYEEVLSNLAMFEKQKDSLPWHMKLTQGSVQLADSVNPSYSYVWPAIANTFGFGISRGWTVSWTMVPEVDSDKLYALQQIYQNAVKDFFVNYDKGSIPPIGATTGKYGNTYVWARENKLDSLTNLTLTILKNSPVALGERAFQLPGPPLSNQQR